MDELFEALTWRQLGLHAKPIFVLNQNGYWDPLLALMDQIVDQGFADASLRNFLTVVPDVDTLTTDLAAVRASAS
jgi:predicted Rossmann-fold nucleotide-binding protein